VGLHCKFTYRVDRGTDECVIDAKEQRDVATANIPSAFMQTEMDEIVHMRLEGTMVDILVEYPEKYGPYITSHNGKNVPYVQLMKALYGMLQAALMFWWKLSQSLIDWGFTINQYDQCVANKQMNVKQCTYCVVAHR
jgi:hypothetical protein